MFYLLVASVRLCVRFLLTNVVSNGCCSDHYHPIPTALLPDISRTWDLEVFVDVSIFMAAALTVRRKKMSSKPAFSSLNPMTFFSQSLNERMRASQRGANQINPSLGLEPLICNLISSGCLGHEDTQQGQGLLYREICAFGRSLGFDQQPHPA